MPVDIFQESRVLRLGRWRYKLKVIGEENIPEEGPFIAAFNHSARYLDTMSIRVVKIHRPDAVAFGAVGMPPSGLIARVTKRRSERNEEAEPGMLGAIKARGFSGVELLKALKLLSAGRAVVIAAEGEVPWDGQMIHPLAPGAAWMGLRTNVPIIPIVMIGGYDILPRWRDYPKLTGRLTMRVGQPFYVGDQVSTQVDDQAISKASQTIYEKMVSLINQGQA
jgi:1-acyl-sn-glycerol-3-phosphate acyltransferase